MSSLFIPKVIRVGFVKRSDTYTKQLAYVIYYDEKGQIRKETSWEGWRDKGIDPEEFDNEPQDGFHLNKGIRRYKWSSFGSNRSMIRIYDSRGIEFEITPENLIGVLTETNCFKRGLEGKFVYAWLGKDLVLLPCSSQEYTEAVENTERRGKTISARDLMAGGCYTTKTNEQVIYLGRFLWFTWDSYGSKGRVSQKKHIFAHLEKSGPTHEKQDRFFPKSDARFLATLDSTDPVQNYAELMNELGKDVRSSTIEDWKKRPLKAKNIFDRTEANNKNSGNRLKRHSFTTMEGELITFWELHTVYVGSYYNAKHDAGIRGYSWDSTGTLNTRTLEYTRQNHRYYSFYNRETQATAHDEKTMREKLGACVEIDMVLSSGKKVHLKNINRLVLK